MTTNGLVLHLIQPDLVRLFVQVFFGILSLYLTLTRDTMFLGLRLWAPVGRTHDWLR